MASAPAPHHLSCNQLFVLMLTSLKVELATDFAGTLNRYGLSSGVGHVIASLSLDQISKVPQQCAHESLLSVANSHNDSYWAELRNRLR